jgi:hypothetical protein
MHNISVLLLILFLQWLLCLLRAGGFQFCIADNQGFITFALIKPVQNLYGSHRCLGALNLPDSQARTSFLRQ